MIMSCYKRCNSAGHYKGDGYHLAPQVNDVANEFSIEGGHY